MGPDPVPWPRRTRDTPVPEIRPAASPGEESRYVIAFLWGWALAFGGASTAAHRVGPGRHVDIGVAVDLEIDEPRRHHRRVDRRGGGSYLGDAAVGAHHLVIGQDAGRCHHERAADNDRREMPHSDRRGDVDVAVGRRGVVLDVALHEPGVLGRLDLPE